MALTAGSRLGGYEILASIGAGGMGEVWRARDSKLGREVAIKVLPHALADDAQYMARFEREAQTLASLNHPNIATVYAAEQGALVMELVDGPTLAERIAQGPVPIAEALPILRQIADALESAHERGIIHRDLKPANIQIAANGAVKLLDFGLAKTAEARAASASGASPTLSPTLSLAMTQAGNRGPDMRIMAVDYSAQGDSFVAGKPRVWSEIRVTAQGTIATWDLAPDGKRIAMLGTALDERQKPMTHLTFLLNFADELQRHK